MTITIALDAMGGDHAPRAVIDGALLAEKRNPKVQFILVGQEEAIHKELDQAGVARDRFGIRHASQVVAMDEKPATAMRTKRDSSIRVGANMVKSREVDALVSSGNTGALMAIARYVLKTLPGIDRPAIASIVPSIPGKTLMLDLGANVDCSVDHLCQFTLMGRVFAESYWGMDNPRIGLLNIGEEEMKGNEVVRQAGEILKQTEKFFIGNVEATDVFLGGVDVVVCDGFVGNVSLKTAEGVAKMLSHFLKEAFGQSLLSKIGYLFAAPALKKFRSRVDPREYNGALLLGLNGVVVKSHGGADGLAFSTAIQTAVKLATHQVTDKIRQNVIPMQEAEKK
ncbi:MAG: phosphate acyltransferase PlsX [Magnetococcales bacterium]|nr:phosphate acyltransferase PlsX [Magnetococcales bacterium]